MPPEKIVAQDLKAVVARQATTNCCICTGCEKFTLFCTRDVYSFVCVIQHRNWPLRSTILHAHAQDLKTVVASRQIVAQRLMTVVAARQIVAQDLKAVVTSRQIFAQDLKRVVASRQLVAQDLKAVVASRENSCARSQSSSCPAGNHQLLYLYRV